MTMKQTLSEFMGCMSWGKDELCDLIDKLHEDIEARDGLIRDMLVGKVKESTCMDFSGRYFFIGRDIETINGYRKRMSEIGVVEDEGLMKTLGIDEMEVIR